MIKLMSLKQAVSADLSRIYPTTTLFAAVKAMVYSAPFSAAFLYRLSNTVHRKNKVLATIVARINITVNGIDIDPRAQIEDGVLFQHPTGVVIGGGVKIGAYSTLMAGVTLGRKHLGFDDIDGYPTLGAYVTVGANSTILGPIDIANQTTVGANSVVLHNTQSRSIWAGNPARLIRSTD